MGFDYDWWFAFPPPDLQQVLNQVDEEYFEELAIEDEKWLFFYQSEPDGTFYLYCNEPDGRYQRESTLLLTVNLTSTIWEGKQELPVGELDVRYAWSVEVGKSNHAKAAEVYTRLLRTVLQCYVGDFATLFQAESLEACRLDERLYLDQSSGLAHEPLLSLLDLNPGYEVGDYPSI